MMASGEATTATAKHNSEAMSAADQNDNGKIASADRDSEVPNAAADRINAAAERINAAADRANAAADRTNAAADRTNAAAKRINAAADRTNAAADRTNAAADRTNAARHQNSKAMCTTAAQNGEGANPVTDSHPYVAKERTWALLLLGGGRFELLSSSGNVFFQGQSSLLVNEPTKSAISADATRIACAGIEARCVTVIDVQTGKCVHRAGLDFVECMIMPSPDLVLCGDGEGNLNAIHVKTATRAAGAVWWHAHTGAVRAVDTETLCADGHEYHRVLSGGDDRIIVLSEIGSVVRYFEGHTAGVTVVKFTELGICSVSERECMVWCETGRCLRLIPVTGPLWDVMVTSSSLMLLTNVAGGYELHWYTYADNDVTNETGDIIVRTADQREPKRVMRVGEQEVAIIRWHDDGTGKTMFTLE